MLSLGFVFLSLLLIPISVQAVPSFPLDVVPPRQELCFDLNFDGKVDFEDVQLVLVHFGSTERSSKWCSFVDFNSDGKVDVSDLARILSRCG